MTRDGKSRMSFHLLFIRSCEVQLTRQCYTIVSDTRRESGLIGQKSESLEQLLELIMGGKEFSSLLMRLTANKLNSSS